MWDNEAWTGGRALPDFLAVDEATLKQGRVPRVESISVKKRTFSKMHENEVRRQVQADTGQAVRQYGGSLEVRRPGHPLYGRTVQVSKVHLVYAADGVGGWRSFIQRLCDEAGVEAHFE
jgi:hypothetical protein